MAKPAGNIGIGFGPEDTFVGNFGFPVHLACPKDFTLTPVNRLEPMGYDMNKLPRDMQITSQKDQIDVDIVR